MMNDADSRIREELVADEILLWAGRPRQGLVFRIGEWLRFPVHLLLLAFAIFWEVLVITMGAPIGFRIVGVFFVCVGLYLNFGRIWGDAYERSKTYYGLTNKRVIIIWGLLWQSVRSIPLELIEDVLIREDIDRSGTITFIRPWSIIAEWLPDRWNYYRVPGVPQFEMHVRPAFERIDDARIVIEIIQKALEDARSLTKNQLHR